MAGLNKLPEIPTKSQAVFVEKPLEDLLHMKYL